MSDIAQHDNQSIIVITEDCSVTTERINNHLTDAQTLSAGIGKPYVVIVDVSQCDETYKDVMAVLSNSGLSSRSTQSPDYVLLVGSDGMLEAFRSQHSRPQYGNTLIPIFADRGHAIQMAQHLLRVHR